MSDNNTTYNSGMGLITLIIAYAIHLWAIGEKHVLLADITYWYLVVSLFLIGIVLLALVIVGILWTSHTLYELTKVYMRKR